VNWLKGTIEKGVGFRIIRNNGNKKQDDKKIIDSLISFK